MRDMTRPQQNLAAAIVFQFQFASRLGSASEYVLLLKECALNKMTDDSISLPSTYCANKFYPYKYALTPVLLGSQTNQ